MPPPAGSGSSASSGSAARSEPPLIVARQYGGFVGQEKWKVGVWADGVIRIQAAPCEDVQHTTAARVTEIVDGLRKLDLARAPAEIGCSDAYQTEVSFGDSKGEFVVRDDCAKDKLGLLGSALALLRSVVDTSKCGSNVLTYNEATR